MRDTHPFAGEFLRPDPTERAAPTYLYGRLGKRVFDIVLALLLLPVLAPLILILCALTRIDGGPAFFAHQRIDRNGVRFKCLKIRSMVPDAENVLKSFLESNRHAAREWEMRFKLTDDPRITSIGAFLRRTGLDELPQIWNVLRGDMSFVGPRPVTAPELGMYGPHKTAYLSVRPGVTGAWQIHGRTTGCYVNRVALDRSYVEGLSLRRDLALIGQTAFSVVKMTGS
jgi:lipopolysaccharide/colanic/teichoic acid biosynthesis glycosyltransferase